MKISFAKLSPDILHVLCEDWLTSTDIIHLDSACCERELRGYIMSVLQHACFSLKYELNNPHFMSWLQLRGIRSCHLSFTEISSLNQFINALKIKSSVHSPFISVKSLLIDNIRDAGVDCLVEELQFASQLTTLALRNASSNETVSKIIQSIPVSSRLQSLDLYDFHDYLGSSFVSSVAVRHNLSFVQILDLSSSNFDSRGDWFTSPPLCPYLKTLRLNQCFSATDNFVVKLVNCYGPQLKRLELNSCEDLGNDALFAILDECDTLEHLEIAGPNKMTADSLDQLAHSVFSLTSLNISQHWFLRCEALQAIVSHLALTEIRTLQVSRNIVGTDNAFLIHLAEHAPDLVTLDLSYCYKITDAGLLSIAMCCSSLRSINLCYCNKISNMSVQILVTHCAMLEELQLLMCLLLTDDIIITIAETCQKLKILNISACEKITDIGLWGLAAGFVKRTLIQFEISDNNQITMEAISHLVSQCRLLSKLNVINCSNLSRQSIKKLQSDYQSRLELLDMNCYSQIVLEIDEALSVEEQTSES